jgi:hypothetical protein
MASECTCYLTDEKYWTRYGSAVEPGSQMEPNPDCPVHCPRGYIPETLRWAR